MNLYKRIKYYLTEMSESKSKIERDIKYNSRELIEHLLKCLLFQNTTNNLNHWGQEVYSYLKDVQKLKGSNKLPSEKMLYNCTLGYFADSLLMKLNIYIESICEEENISIKEYDKKLLYDCIIDYYKWLVPILSTKGAVKPSEVKAQINILINKYNTESTHKQKVGA